ncbi:hypothetical protein [Bacillus sp. SM2101]|uniref:hypothetical protein n=1 Tax=Bacillus sp. SM2101 TaxID=2805366 RepID=UPI001BDDEC40|nr:hypothetical protein [Bacillus sp. SM2101]
MNYTVIYVCVTLFSVANGEKTNTNYELTQSALKTALYPFSLEIIKEYQEKNKPYVPFSMNFN